MLHRTALLFSLLATALVAGCQHLSKEGPETSPVGPSILSEATIQEALLGPVSFKKHVQPLLQHNCQHCHDGKVRPDLVNFNKRSSVFARGPYGPRLVPGKPDQSLIVNNLSFTHAPVKTMPPVGNRLTPDETKILRNWITEGAHWPGE